MSNTPTRTLRSLKEIVRYNPVEIYNFPEEPEGGYHSLPDCKIVKQLKKSGFLESEGYCGGSHVNCDDGGCDVKIYHLTQYGEHMIDMIEMPNTLPCGHQGLRNLRDGDFTCQKESCEMEFREETVKQTYF